MKTRSALLAFVMLYTCARAQQPVNTLRDTTATSFFKRSTGVIAGDGGYTVPLADGRSVWLFGDSHIDDFNPADGTIPCLFQVNNTALVQSKNSWNRDEAKTLMGTGPGLRSLFKSNQGEKDFYWPVTGIQLKDTVYVFCAGISLTKAGGGMGFGPTFRNAFAKLKYPELTMSGYTNLAPANGVNYGVGFIKLGKYVYAYGNKFDTKTASSEIYAARFMADKPYGKWDYWDGKTWQADPVKATVIAHGAAGTPQVTKLKNKYILVSSELSITCDMGTGIYTAVSDSPTGPFTERKKIHNIDNRVNGHSPFFTYPPCTRSLLISKATFCLPTV